jgi:hypothetical protein
MQGYPAQAQEGGPTVFGDPDACACGCGGSGACGRAARGVPWWVLGLVILVGGWTALRRQS